MTPNSELTVGVKITHVPKILTPFFGVKITPKNYGVAAYTEE